VGSHSRALASAPRSRDPEFFDHARLPGNLPRRSACELGGAPRTIVPDNLKAAVIRAAFGVDGAASFEPQLPRIGAALQDQDRSGTDLRTEGEWKGHLWTTAISLAAPCAVTRLPS
jgi:hypothetical protein